MCDKKDEKKPSAEDNEMEGRKDGEYINIYEVSKKMEIRTQIDISPLVLNSDRTELTDDVSDLGYGCGYLMERPYDELGRYEYHYNGAAYNNSFFSESPDILKNVKFAFDLQGKYHLLFDIVTDQDVTIYLNGHGPLNQDKSEKIDCFSGNGRRATGRVDVRIDKSEDLDSFVVTGSFEHESERPCSFIIYFDQIDLID